MTNIKGTNVASGIVPFTTEDNFPTHYSKYGKGGWREVNTIAERDDIPEARRSVGMIVYVVDNNIAYILKGGITNDNWFAAILVVRLLMIKLISTIIPKKQVKLGKLLII